MSYSNAFGVDDLVDRKKEFVNKIVVLNGKLTGYEMGPGILIWPLRLIVEGSKWIVSFRCNISRINREHHILLPYLKAFRGEQIGLKASADSNVITAIKFGTVEFKVIA